MSASALLTTRRMALALAIYTLPTLGLLGQGLVYLTTSRFMPYHEAALETQWEALPASTQGFLLGVLRGMGAGSFAVALALLLMIFIPLRRGEAWARWAVPLVGVVFTVLTAYAAYTIDRATPADTPWGQTLALTTTYLAGAALSAWPKPRNHGLPNSAR